MDWKTYIGLLATLAALVVGTTLLLTGNSDAPEPPDPGDSTEPLRRGPSSDSSPAIRSRPPRIGAVARRDERENRPAGSRRLSGERARESDGSPAAKHDEATPGSDRYDDGTRSTEGSTISRTLDRGRIRRTNECSETNGGWRPRPRKRKTESTKSSKRPEPPATTPVSPISIDDSRSRPRAKSSTGATRHCALAAPGRAVD